MTSVMLATYPELFAGGAIVAGAPYRCAINAARGLRTPEFIVVNGGAGLEKALWPRVPTQRCTVHNHRNLLAHAPERLHDELGERARIAGSSSTRCRERLSSA